MSFVDNISKVMGAQNFKAGFYFEHTGKFQVGGTNPRGAFNFSPTTTNPIDSGDGYSNALLGVLNTYSEGNQRVNGDWIFNNLESYVQDNWRVNKRLTVDLGMRRVAGTTRSGNSALAAGTGAQPLPGRRRNQSADCPARQERHRRCRGGPAQPGVVHLPNPVIVYPASARKASIGSTRDARRAGK